VPGVTLRVAPTDALGHALLADLRTLLDAAFPNDFSDDDWRHALGGVHVWVAGPAGLISHGSVVERTLVCGDQAVRVGYVEAVATAMPHRRQGHGSAVMRQIGELIQETYQLGGLSTGAHGFYETLGWELWRGPTFVDAPTGRTRTPTDDDSVMILRTPRAPDLDLAGDLVCDWRAGDVW
jgi:aminoglycoside 2'-N-acetyltransferase I